MGVAKPSSCLSGNADSVWKTNQPASQNQPPNQSFLPQCLQPGTAAPRRQPAEISSAVSSLQMSKHHTQFLHQRKQGLKVPVGGSVVQGHLLLLPHVLMS